MYQRQQTMIVRRRPSLSERDSESQRFVRNDRLVVSQREVGRGG